MGKTLHIKDPEAYRLAQELAQKTGASLTRSVVVALREQLQRLNQQGRSEDLVAEIDEIARRITALPIVDSRTDDDILGYNEHGVPD